MICVFHGTAGNIVCVHAERIVSAVEVTFSSHGRSFHEGIRTVIYTDEDNGSTYHLSTPIDVVYKRWCDALRLERDAFPPEVSE